MNKNSYNKLPDDLKAIIDANSGVDASGWAGRAMDEGDVRSLKVTQGTDNVIHQISEETTEEIKALSATLADEWVKEMDGLGLDGQAMFDDANQMIADETK